MSRKSGRNKRLSLYDRGDTACPICLTGFTRGQAYSGRKVTLEHVPINALGGQARCLTCGNCNDKAGRSIDQVAAMSASDRFGVTVDILGKRDTFMLSLDGKELTRPFAGYSKEDWRDLEKTESPRLTMEYQDPRQVGCRHVFFEVGVSRSVLSVGEARRILLYQRQCPNTRPATDHGAT